MRAALLLAAFFGWGVVAALASQASPGFGVLIGIAVGAGIMYTPKDQG